jgi:hypothetical protein
MPNIGAQAMSSGDFGESYVAYLLAKAGVEVVRAKTVGFDLFVMDAKKTIFPTKKLIGVSVKARISKVHEKYAPTIPMGSSKVRKAAKIWRAKPWVAVVVGHSNNTFDVYLFPHSRLKSYKGAAKRKDVVSASSLRNATPERVLRLT